MADLDPTARVTPEQVTDIISTTLTESQVNAMINTAHQMVDQKLAGKGLAVDRLTLIELWLSAHFVCIRDPRKKQVKIDEMSVSYQGEVGLELQGTQYGQQAILLDPTGTLASASQKKTMIRVK